MSCIEFVCVGLSEGLAIRTGIWYNIFRHCEVVYLEVFGWEFY